MSSLSGTFYTGDAIDTNAAAVVPNNTAHLPAIWSFCTSPAFVNAVRRIDQATKVTNTFWLVKIPFNLAHWQKIAAEKYPDGFYAEVTLSYDAAIAQENGGRPFAIESLRPIQMSKSDVLDVCGRRRRSSPRRSGRISCSGRSAWSRRR